MWELSAHGIKYRADCGNVFIQDCVVNECSVACVGDGAKGNKDEGSERDGRGKGRAVEHEAVEYVGARAEGVGQGAGKGRAGRESLEEQG